MTIGEDECDIIITQACIQNSGSLSAGTVVSLLATTEGSSWVTLARFRTTESESTPLRIVVAAGSELTLKVSNGRLFVLCLRPAKFDFVAHFQVTGKGAVDIVGYQVLPEDDEVESEGVSMDSESADEEEVAPPPGKRKPETHPDAASGKAAKGDASSQPNQAAKQVKPAASNPAAQQPKTPPAQIAQAAASAEVGADFIASPKFTGSRAGFVFKKGPKGVGYYRDTPPSPGKSVAAAAAQPKKQSADEWAKEVRIYMMPSTFSLYKQHTACSTVHSTEHKHLPSPGSALLPRYIMLFPSLFSCASPSTSLFAYLTASLPFPIQPNPPSSMFPSSCSSVRHIMLCSTLSARRRASARGSAVSAAAAPHCSGWEADAGAAGVESGPGRAAVPGPGGRGGGGRDPAQRAAGDGALHGPAGQGREAVRLQRGSQALRLHLRPRRGMAPAPYLASSRLTRSTPSTCLCSCILTLPTRFTPPTIFDRNLFLCRFQEKSFHTPLHAAMHYLSSLQAIRRASLPPNIAIFAMDASISSKPPRLLVLDHTWSWICSSTGNERTQLGWLGSARLARLGLAGSAGSAELARLSWAGSAGLGWLGSAWLARLGWLG
jgi:hypothetical protein